LLRRGGDRRHIVRSQVVTFVRESVWMGDGIHFYLWDGETFIGTLSAGTLVQYRVAPGPHVLMANSENWSYVKADLQPASTTSSRQTCFRAS
jgi:hypothetical protein